MVPISPQPAAAAEYAVDGPCEANGETADATGERASLVGLDDEVDVIVLDGEMDDAKARMG